MHQKWNLGLVSTLSFRFSLAAKRGRVLSNVWVGEAPGEVKLVDGETEAQGS